MTCKDCLHFDVCYIVEHYGADTNEECAEHDCKQFKDRSRYVVREKGEWILEAHQERANYRWNVTAECPICHAEKKEIYAGFFPGFPKDLAEQTILDRAKSIKLSDFCPNCGADMTGGDLNV